MTRPNLFANATSELTQDAVLCWLLNWADPGNEEVDADLHQTGRELLHALLATHGTSPPTTAASVTAKRQVKRIDVVVWVGDEYLIGIEDKTDTGPHGNQLARYRTTLDTLAEGRTVVPIYVKTGERNEDAHVRAKGWSVFGRQALLDVLRRSIDCGVKNDILAEFRDWLERKEHQATAWRRLPTAESWPWASWQGFYGALEERMPWADHLGWSYVANPAGGFLAMWGGVLRNGPRRVPLRPASAGHARDSGQGPHEDPAPGGESSVAATAARRGRRCWLVATAPAASREWAVHGRRLLGRLEGDGARRSRGPRRDSAKASGTDGVAGRTGGPGGALTGSEPLRASRAEPPRYPGPKPGGGAGAKPVRCGPREIGRLMRRSP